ncbi:alpha/beta hydrolase [Streptomyces sp. M10(2022)]
MQPQQEWTPTRYAHNGDVQLAIDQLKGSEGQPLLLVMGLATARFWWPSGLCRAFADAGFAVARYDQRDAGQSSRMPDTATTNPFKALLAKRGNAYTSEDMTDDAIAVMDELGWERAHVFGHSLGGAIAQRIALRHPDRVLSVTSSAALPSDVSGLGILRYLRFGLLARLARTTFPEGREGDIEAALTVWRGIASPGYPSTRPRPRLGRGRRGQRPARQQGAEPPDRRPVARTQAQDLHRPTLVLHGEQDPILRVSAGRATARAIDGAHLVTYRASATTSRRPVDRHRPPGQRHGGLSVAVRRCGRVRTAAARVTAGWKTAYGHKTPYRARNHRPGRSAGPARPAHNRRPTRSTRSTPTVLATPTDRGCCEDRWNSVVLPGRSAVRL